MNIELVRTRDGFLSLEQDWERLSRESGEAEFYRSFDWFNAVICLARDAPEELYIVTVRSDGELIAVLPCTLVRRTFRLFTLRTLELIGNIYSPVRGGLAKPGREDEVAEAVADFLLTDCRWDWDLIHFEAVSNSDPFLPRLLTAFRTRKLRSRTLDQFANVVTDLSGLSDAEAYVKSLSKNLRQNIRSGINRMNRNGSFDVVLVQNAQQDVQRAMDDYYHIYGQSWKVTEGDPDFHRKLAAYLAPKGSLRVFTLYFREGAPEDGSEKPPPSIASYKDPVNPDARAPDGYLPIAVYFFVVSGTWAYFLKTAYREEYARYSTGNVLFWLAIKHLLQVDGIDVIDHQKGDEPYKLRWGDVRETRVLYQAANLSSAKARLELWAERNVVPLLRRVKRLVKRPTAERGDEP